MLASCKYAISLLSAATILGWPVQAGAESVALRVEGRVHKVDADVPVGFRIHVGARFILELTYDTDAKGIVMVKDLKVGLAQPLTGHEQLLGKVNHSSRAGGWDRVRLTFQDVDSLDVKIAFDSRAENELILPAGGRHTIPVDGLEIVLSGEKFFHFVYADSHTRGHPDGLISGEITSLTRIDG